MAPPSGSAAPAEAESWEDQPEVQLEERIKHDDSAGAEAPGGWHAQGARWGAGSHLPPPPPKLSPSPLVLGFDPGETTRRYEHYKAFFAATLGASLSDKEVARMAMVEAMKSGGAPVAPRPALSGG